MNVHPSVTRLLRSLVEKPFELFRGGSEEGKSPTQEAVEATGDKEIIGNFKRNVRDMTPSAPAPTLAPAPAPKPPSPF